VPDTRELRAPRTPFNGTITAHRRFAFGSLPLADVKLVKNHFGMTVNDVVMALTAAALRRWLLDHDALPTTPLVGAVPVSIRTDGRERTTGNQISVMLAELPTQLRDPEARLHFMRESMLDAKRAFEAVPASLLQDVSALVPTALSGLAARALFKLATVPGVPFNLFVSNVPGPQLPLYIAGARVEGIHPVSAVTDLTGGLNITLFSYDGSLDFGLIACREMVPDVWNLIEYLQDAMAEMVALVPVEAPGVHGGVEVCGGGVGVGVVGVTCQAVHGDGVHGEAVRGQAIRGEPECDEADRRAVWCEQVAGHEIRSTCVQCRGRSTNEVPGCGEASGRREIRRNGRRRPGRNEGRGDRDGQEAVSAGGSAGVDADHQEAALARRFLASGPALTMENCRLPWCAHHGQ
jgi:hypothetical protein